jgi:hypothetical protein
VSRCDLTRGRKDRSGARHQWSSRGHRRRGSEIAADQHSRVDYALFEGFEVQGKVKKTFLRGNLIVDGDRWLGREGMGEFLKRGPSGRL